MNTNIFIPKKIRVGFQKRDDTYTKQLAYVIYYDEKDKLRKQKSWESWRNKNIKPQDYENTPRSGFVLNKKVGGYASDWGNFRQAYVRVYDPYGFEFEITIPNLLFILENTSSIKGKGLEGEFVYAWDGADLLLIPTSSPDYIAMSDFSNMVDNHERIRIKDLVPGGTYRDKKNNDLIYLGKFKEYKSHYNYHTCSNEKVISDSFFFYSETTSFVTMKSISGRILKTVSTAPTYNYAEIMDKLSHQTIFSPIDPAKDEYIKVDIERLKEYIGDYGTATVYIQHDGKYVCGHVSKIEKQYFLRIYAEYYQPINYQLREKYRHVDYENNVERSLETLMNEVTLYKRNEYLENGNLYTEHEF